jgi:hypothetical protein
VPRAPLPNSGVRLGGHHPNSFIFSLVVDNWIGLVRLTALGSDVPWVKTRRFSEGDTAALRRPAPRLAAAMSVTRVQNWMSYLGSDRPHLCCSEPWRRIQFAPLRGLSDAIINDAWCGAPLPQTTAGVCEEQR